jgi:hypothetical protein
MVRDTAFQVLAEVMQSVYRLLTRGCGERAKLGHPSP